MEIEKLFNEKEECKGSKEVKEYWKKKINP